MKKEKLFLALLTTAMATPATLSVTNSITPVLAEEMESETNSSSNSTIDIDSSNGALTLKFGNQTFENVSTSQLSLGSFSYTGSAITLEVTATWTPNDGKKVTLKEGTDFSIVWTKNINVGTATGKLEFIGSYKGVPRTIQFGIQPKNLTKDSTTITFLQGDTYSLGANSNEVTPAISVNVGNLSLVNDVDYTVEYSNNDKAGTGTVTITGKGNFKGTVSKNFTIKGIALNDIPVSLPLLNGITTTKGSVTSKEKTILQNYLNREYNPYKYSYVVENATVQATNGDNLNFMMTISAFLKEESEINLTFTNLKISKSVEDTIIEENEFVDFIDLEETEAASLEYVHVDDPKGDGTKVTIQGIKASDAFRVNGKINSTNIRNILLNEGYKVNNLDFDSSQGKESKFAISNLQTPISIAVTTSKKVTPTTPVGGDGIIQLPTTPAQPTPPIVIKKPAYRFYNTLTGEHFYTTSEVERDELIKDSRWNNEGQGWISPATSKTAVYRLCNPTTGEHHYTTDKNEYDTLPFYGWKQEGVGFYSADPQMSGIAVVYRLFNPKSNDAGSHHYTMSEQERNNLVNNGWRDEGIAWYSLR